MYRQHFGVVPVTTRAPSPLDVMAALSEDGRQLTIGVVNPAGEAVTIELQLTGASLSGNGRSYQIAGDDEMAFNAPGVEPQVTIEERALRGTLDKVEVPPCSVTLYSLNVE